MLESTYHERAAEGRDGRVFAIEASRSSDVRARSRRQRARGLVLLCCALAATTNASADSPESALAAEATVRRGVDVGKYRAMVDGIKHNPEHGRLEFRALSESEEVAYHATTRIGGFKAAGQELGQTREYLLHLGLPIELQTDVVAPVDRIEPLELALAGLADCVIGTISIHALDNDIQLDHITASVRAPIDIQVFLGLKDLDERDEIFGQISIDVEIEGPDLSEADRKLLAQHAKRSVVFNLVALAHDTEPTVTIRSKAVQP